MMRIFSWVLFGLWFVAINIVSSIPGPVLPPGSEIPFLDKLVHFVAFFAGALLLDNALRQSRRPMGIPRFLLAFGFIVVFAIVDELRQIFTPGRYGADPYDLLANILGALTGASISLSTHAGFRRIFRR